MAESPLAIRVSENVKALFNELAEAGEFENKGDFLNRLLISYQSEVVKEEISVLKPAIETVEILTSRLLEVLNGAATSIMTKEEKHGQELVEQKKSFDETRGILQQRVTLLERELADDEGRIKQIVSDKEIAEDKARELLQQIEQLRGSVEDKANLIEEYRAKNDALNSIVTEYKQAADDNKSMIETVSGLKQENERLLQELRQKEEIFELEKERLLVDKDAEMLMLKAEYQKEIQARQASSSEELRALLERIEAYQTSVPKASTTSRKRTTKKANEVTEDKVE